MVETWGVMHTSVQVLHPRRARMLGKANHRGGGVDATSADSCGTCIELFPAVILEVDDGVTIGRWGELQWLVLAILWAVVDGFAVVVPRGSSYRGVLIEAGRVSAEAHRDCRGGEDFRIRARARKRGCWEM